MIEENFKKTSGNFTPTFYFKSKNFKFHRIVIIIEVFIDKF